MAILETMVKFLEAESNGFGWGRNERKNELRTWLSRNNIRDFIDIYYNYADDISRRIIDRLIYMSLGRATEGRRPKFDYYSEQEWQELCRNANACEDSFESYELDMVETFVLEGYNCRNICCAQKGDIIFDCGAYTGNTTLYFSRIAGENGRVYALEAMPGNFAILEQNIKSKNLGNCRLIHGAVAGREGEVTFAEEENYGSHRAEQGIPVPAFTIDAIVAREQLEKVDFIKMDIEGSEVEALDGAKETIQKFKPDLAICIYHRASDFITIPKKLMAFEPGYRFYLKHNSYTFFETVLFAKYAPDMTATPPPPELQNWNALLFLTYWREYSNRLMQSA